MTLGWHLIGKFRVLAMLLPSNPAFTTHRIYIGKLYIGAQLSVPSESDCQWHEHQANNENCQPGEITSKPYGFTAVHHYRGQPGRKKKADHERELTEAIAAD